MTGGRYDLTYAICLTVSLICVVIGLNDGDNTWGVSAWKEIVFPELPEEIEQ